MNKNKKFIVVKCGNDNEYNAATEIDKVITKNGFGWFAINLFNSINVKVLR